MTVTSILELNSRSLVAVAALASSLVALAGSQATAMGSRTGAPQRATRTATVAVVTTQEVRVAVVATRVSGASPAIAEVRVGFARRVGASWREFDEQRLRESYFWNTVSRPHSVCRLQIATVGTRRSPRSQLTVQLLLSPSVGCGRIHRFRLPTR
jgi:hypothetical protein